MAPDNTIGDKELQRVELDMDSWQALHFPSAVLAAVVSVKKGVKRAHLVDARVDGALLHPYLHAITLNCAQNPCL